MPIDLKLDLDEHDITIENYDLALVDKLDQVRQKITIKLNFYSGEWFLDTTVGVPLFDVVFVKNPDLNIIASVMKTEILSVEGVKSILEYSQTYDSTNRILEITFIADTIYGELEDTVEVL